jgi:anti-sigma B factor antagonist
MADLDPADQDLTLVDIREENGTPVIWLFGELDITNAEKVRAAIDTVLCSHTELVVFDASGLAFMDSSGVALLASTAQRAREVQVRRPATIVRRLIELTGLDQVLRITI